jgi:hypothetical protein
MANGGHTGEHGLRTMPNTVIAQVVLVYDFGGLCTLFPLWRGSQAVRQPAENIPWASSAENLPVRCEP